MRDWRRHRKERRLIDRMTAREFAHSLIQTLFCGNPGAQDSRRTCMFVRRSISKFPRGIDYFVVIAIVSTFGFRGLCCRSFSGNTVHVVLLSFVGMLGRRSAMQAALQLSMRTMGTRALILVSALICLYGVDAFSPSFRSLPGVSSRGIHLSTVGPAPLRMSLDDVSASRGGFLQNSAATGISGYIALHTSAGLARPARAEQLSAWEQIPLPVATVLYDIAFDPSDPDHGLVVGAQGTFLEVRILLVSV